jgi:GGDEF domain-containing protein/CHASE3 domain sensor protein
VLAAGGAAAFAAWQRAEAELARWHEAERGVTNWLHAMDRAESALRDYLVSGNADELAAYNAAAERAESARAGMGVAGTDAPTEARLEQASRLAESALAEWERAAVARGAQGSSPVVREGLPIDARVRALDAVLAPVRENATAAAAEIAARAARLRSAVHAAFGLLLLAVAGTIAALAAQVRRERGAREAIEALHAREARHDPRTRLPNRRSFTEWVGYAIAGCQRGGGGLGLLMASVDAGDVRLRADGLAVEIANRLRALKRDSDFLGLIDDHVFALAALDVQDPRHLAGLAQRVLRALSDPPLPGAKLAPIAPSVGIALFPDDADDLPGLLAAADSALSAARRAGGNRVMFHGAAQPIAAVPSQQEP